MGLRKEWAEICAYTLPKLRANTIYSPEEGNVDNNHQEEILVLQTEDFFPLYKSVL